jgi:hypothetical protein
MLPFHTPKWAKVHSDFNEVVRTSYDADELATALDSSRKLIAVTMLQSARQASEAKGQEMLDFLSLWFGNMTDARAEVSFDYTMNAVWCWKERR